MPLTTAGVRVVDPILSNVAQGYSNADFVGKFLFPPVPVHTSGGQIIEFGREAFRLYQARRAPGGKTARIQMGYLGKPFTLLQDSLEAAVPREYLRDALLVPGIDLSSRAVNVTMKALNLILEVDQANLATNVSSYSVTSSSVTLSGTTQWSNIASGLSTANPLTDINTGREKIRSLTGIYPNTLMLSAKAFNAVINNTNIINRFMYNANLPIDASQITEKMLAGLFNISNVYIGRGIYFNDANISSDIWGSDAVLAYVPQDGTSLQREEPSFGYTYTMDGNPIVEEGYYDETTKSWVFGVNYERAPVLSGIAAGYLFKAVSA
ncbi:MAG: major capsid protein [Methylococcales bacterium]